MFKTTVGSANESINSLSLSFCFGSISIEPSIKALKIIFPDLKTEVYRFILKNKYYRRFE
jgi:hypothetical protein